MECKRINQFFSVGLHAAEENGGDESWYSFQHTSSLASCFRASVAFGSQSLKACSEELYTSQYEHHWFVAHWIGSGFSDFLLGHRERGSHGGLGISIFHLG